MEDIFRKETPPASPDHAVRDGCTDELTRSNSEMSSLTAESSKYTTFHRLNVNVKSHEYTGWTNEKHNLYLDHLEASFIDQLHQSMSMRTLCSEQGPPDSNTSCKPSAKTRNTSEQFMALQDSCWKKNNYIESDCADVNSHWTSRVRHGGKHKLHSINASADLQEYSMLPRGRMQLRGKRNSSHSLTTSCNQISVNNFCHSGDPAEVSDQNFVDGEQERSETMVKRLKNGITDASAPDQIVPSGLSTFTTNSLEREEQECQDWKSENLKKFVCIKSFLRELKSAESKL